METTIQKINRYTEANESIKKDREKAIIEGDYIYKSICDDWIIENENIIRNLN